MQSARTSIGSLVGMAVLALVTSAPAQVAWRNGPAARTESSRPALMETLREPGSRGAAARFVVRLDAPVTDAERAQLERAGLTLQTYLGANTWFARTAASGIDVSRTRNVASLADAQAIQTQWKLHPALADTTALGWAGLPATEGGDGGPWLAVYVLFHPDVTSEARWNAVESLGGIVHSEMVSLNALAVELPLETIETLAANDDVMYVEAVLPGLTPINDGVRALTGAEVVQDPPYNLDGSGVTVMVLDGGGASETHADLQGRVTVMDGSPKISHATHVAGIIAADGTASVVADPGADPLQYRGVAPGSTILSYNIGGFNEGIPPEGILFLNEPRHLEMDIADAIANGAVIGNASLALTVSNSSILPCDLLGDYTVVSGIIDSIVRGAFGAPFRSVWGAGNERSLSGCGGDTYAKISPPHAAKNHITVGAVNANDDSMTAFSSWGPTDDGRLKPDFVAPGCRSNGQGGIVSTYAFDDWDYLVLCGTSMAAPAVAGLGALLIEDYRVQYPGRELFRNSMLKALLAHTAVDLGKPGPDYRFGYGSVRIQPAIDLMRAGSFWEDNLSQGQSYVRSVTVDPNDNELRVTIAWDDYPAAPNVIGALVNDLDLIVTSPSSVRHYPWTLDPGDPNAPAVQAAEDHLNNIEQVLVANPEAGVWTIEVAATNVPIGPQPFSMVGDGASRIGLAVDFPAGVRRTFRHGVPETMSVQITAAGESIVGGSATVHYRHAGGAFTPVPLVPLGGDLYEVTFPVTQCGDDPEFYVSVEGTLSGVLRMPAGAPADVYVGEVGQMTVIFEDDFETETGWTTGDNGATSGFWERDVPLTPGGVFDKGPATDGDGSGQCYLTDNTPGLSDVDNGGVILTSPVLDMSGTESEFTFWMYMYNNSSAGDDTLTVEMSENGGAGPWIEVYRHQLTTEPIWFRPMIRGSQISAAGISPSATMQIRFLCTDSGPAGTVEGGIDGVVVSTFACVPPGDGDFDFDGDLDMMDFLQFSVCFGETVAAQPACAPGDMAGPDGSIDAADAQAFLTAQTGPG